MKATPGIADFRFRATNTWQGGTHSRTEISGFHGAMQELEHRGRRELDQAGQPLDARRCSDSALASA